jgi:HlyD family secretion protein
MLLAALAGGLWLYLRPDTSGTAGGGGIATIKTATVTRGDLEVRLRITGATSARKYVGIAAPRVRGSGRDLNILDVPNSGAMVKKGQVVAELDPQNVKDSLDDEVDSLRDAANNVKKRKVEQEVDLVNLQQQLRVAKAALDKALLDQKTTEIRTDIDREVLRLAVEEAEASYKELQRDLANQKESQRADMRVLQISYQLQQIRVDRFTNDLAHFTIKTPMDGMVVMLTQSKPGGDQTTLQKGDRISPGQPFMKIIDTSTMQVDATVNQTESSLLRIGQDATVNLDAFPGVTFPGKVFGLGALATPPGRSQYFLRTLPVQVQILASDKRIIPDLSASADVLLEKHSAELLLPLGAVESDGKQSFVYVKNAQGTYDKREVQMGASNATHVIVVSGAKEGDEVRLVQ